MTDPGSNLGGSKLSGGTVLALSASACALIGALAWWSLRPMKSTDPDRSAVVGNSVASPRQSTVIALDESAFRAPLWIAPPVPPSPPPKVEPKPEPPPPPLKLQILAIAHEDGTERALLYDPDTDKPVWVSTGQSLGQRRIEKVTAGSVEIRDGKHLRTLALRESKGTDSPLERALRGTSPRDHSAAIKEGGAP